MALGFGYSGNKLIKNIDAIDFIDCKKVLSIHGAKLLAGQGSTLKSNNPDDELDNFFKRFLKLNRFDDFLLEMAEVSNYWGGVLITINKTETGDFLLDYADPDKLINAGVIGVNEFAATFMKTLNVGTSIFIYKEVWNTSTITRQGMNDDGKTAMSWSEWEQEIPKEFRIPQSETHGLGFVPFILFKNKPGRKVNPINLIQLSDDEPVKALPLLINHVLRQVYKDIIFSKARAFGQFTKAYYAKLKKDGRELATYAADYLTDVEGRGTNAGKPVELQAANPAIITYMDGVAKVWDDYISKAGYSTANNAQGDASVIETLFSKSGDVETTKIKRERWQEALSDLFDKLLVYSGFMTDLTAERPYTFEIKENVIYGEVQLTTMIAEQVNNGFLTKAEAIAKLRGIDLEEAEAIKDEIEKEQDAENEKLMQQAQELQENGDAPTETPGLPQKG